jgi:hypothetical protein
VLLGRHNVVYFDRPPERFSCKASDLGYRSAMTIPYNIRP